MADTPNPGETVVPSKNDGTPAAPAPAATPAVEPPKEDTEVARLRKELEQKTMRENQLANELKAIKDADEARKAKELEENNQYKELLEQEKAKREALETEIQEETKKVELNKAKKEVLSEFSEEVRTLAEETGLELTDTDEASVTAFKEKLEKVSKRLGTDKVGGNNPAPRNDNVELSGDQLREALMSEQGFHDVVVKKFPGIAAMTAPKK